MSEPERAELADPEAVRGRKAMLRVELRARRDALGDDARAAAVRAIEARLVASSILETAHLVHSYIGVGSEVATEELIRGLLTRGQRVICPRVRGRALDHLEVTDLDMLVAGRMGLREPDPERAMAVDLGAIDVMLVPALAFDCAGYRLGYGGGYYDGAIAELLTHQRATTIGLGFDSQVVDEVPREAHDQAVDVIVTETQTIVTGAR